MVEILIAVGIGILGALGTLVVVLLKRGQRGQVEDIVVSLLEKEPYNFRNRIDGLGSSFDNAVVAQTRVNQKLRDSTIRLQERHRSTEAKIGELDVDIRDVQRELKQVSSKLQEMDGKIDILLKREDNR